MFNLKHFIKWNYYYNNVGKSVSWGYDKPDSHIINFINSYNNFIGDKVLDVGCGYGKNATIFLDKGMNYTGIDISKNAITDASKKYQTGKFICSDFINYDFKDELFDFIIDAGCIHVNEPSYIHYFLDKYYLLLKKGGKLFIRIFKREYDSNEPLFYVDNFLPVWGYTELGFLSHIDKNKFYVDKVVLDKDYYIEDEVFYFYLIKK